ncbi:MAG: hypothetical protein R3321_01005 [Nitrososphaeraceae archaeon]|nr:hypothetical protein [Nitrososphaeraceae archaeon]
MLGLGGNAVSKRFLLNNLVIGNIVAASSLEVDVGLAASSGVGPGSVGIAAPNAAMTGAIGINPVRSKVADQITLQFVNASAGAIDPVDTLEFDVFMFTPVGALQQTI